MVETVVTECRRGTYVSKESRSELEGGQSAGGADVSEEPVCVELRDVLQVAEDDGALATQRLRHGVELDLRHVVVDDVVERDDVVCLGLHQLVHDQR